MDIKEKNEREEKDRSDFLAFLRNAAKKGLKQKSQSIDPQITPESNDTLNEVASNNCEECALMSRNTLFLAQHKKSGHRDVSKKKLSFSCSMCDFASFTKCEIKAHISGEHYIERENIVICSIGCLLCSEGRIHLSCDFQTDEVTKNHQRGDNLTLPSAKDVPGIEVSDDALLLKCSSVKGSNRSFKEDNVFQVERFDQKSEGFLMKISPVKGSNEGCEETLDKKVDIEPECQGSNEGSVETNGSKENPPTNDNPKTEKPVRFVSSDQNPVKCNFCDFEARQKLLVVHMKADHPKEALFRCDKCAYKSNWMSNMKIHMNAKHQKVDFKCQHCEYKTYWKSAFHEHMRFKHGFFQRNSKHKRNPEHRKTKKRLKCEQCKLDPHFPHKCTLSNYECDICAYKTTQARYLDSHKKNKHLSREGNWKEIDDGQNKITFVCNECDYKTESKEFITNHEKLSHGETLLAIEDILQCQFCEFQTDNKRYILKHSRKYHPEKIHNVLTCTLCEFEAKTTSEIKEHKRQLHKKNLMCSQCQKPFRFSHNLRKHEQLHLEEKIFSCNQCAETFPFFRKLRRHLKTHWSYTCEVCKKSFDRPKKLNRHKTIHSDVKPYQCNQCDKLFREKRSLVSHQRIQKYTCQKYICPVCGQCFKRAHDLRSHKADHNKKARNKEQHNKEHISKDQQDKEKRTKQQQQYKCDICEKEFKSSYNMKAHKVVHLGNDERTKHFCDKCQFVCYSKKDLKHHMGYVHEGVLYYCDQCEFKCGYKGSLKLHRKVKHEGVVYQCEKCEYTSKHKKIVKQHAEFEHEGITHNCNECDFKSAHKLSLKRHIRLKHKKNEEL